MCDTECKTECQSECKTECKTECVRNELKKLSPEERVRLLQEIHIEEVKAEEAELMSDPMYPVKSAMASMTREIENLKNNIKKLENDLVCCNNNRSVIITNRQPVSNLDLDDVCTEEDCCEGFSWWPVILFFLFVIITSSIGGGSLERCPAMPKFHID